MTEEKFSRERKPTANSTYKKLAVQWLNEVFCFVSSSVVADSFRLRNRQLLVAEKRCAAYKESQPHKQHIWFLPTRKAKAKKTKRAVFCQRIMKQN